MIRPFTPNDYRAVARLINAAYTDAQGRPVAAITAEELRQSDVERPPHCHAGRWVAEQDGMIVGAVEYDQSAYRYHPHKFWMDAYVYPNYQRQGIGAALFQRLMVALAPYQPVSLRCNLREDQVHGVAFLKRRGFVEALRSWESYLEVAKFDTGSFAEDLERVARLGIEIKTLAELEQDPERDRKLYNLSWEFHQDEPDPDIPARESFEDFVSGELGYPGLLPEAFFVAVHGREYVGASYHFRDPERGVLRLAQTGVARLYRQKGIALALRLRGVAYAQARGYTSLRASNTSLNQAMARIDARLGFRKLPAWIDFVKTF